MARRRTTRRNTGPKWVRVFDAPNSDLFIHGFISAAEHNADRDQLLGKGMKLFYLEDETPYLYGNYSMLVEAPSLADAKRHLNHDGIRVLRPWKQTDVTTEPGFLTWEDLLKRAEYSERSRRRRNTGYVAAKIRAHTARKNPRRRGEPLYVILDDGRWYRAVGPFASRREATDNSYLASHLPTRHQMRSQSYGVHGTAYFSTTKDPTGASDPKTFVWREGTRIKWGR